MPPGHIAERVDHSASNAEIENQIPRLREECAEEELNLFGIKGTIEELIQMCPFAGKKDFTVEQENEFIIRGLNHSGGAVKPELFSYISQKLEDMGQEVKITVKEEPEAQSWLREDTDKNEEVEKIDTKASRAKKTKLDLEINEPKIRVKDTPTTVVETPASRRVLSIPGQKRDISETIDKTISETKEVNVEEWFDIMTVEYAERQQHRNLEVNEIPMDDQSVKLRQGEAGGALHKATEEVSADAVGEVELVDKTASTDSESVLHNETIRELSTSETHAEIIEEVPLQKSSLRNDIHPPEAQAPIETLGGGDGVVDQHSEIEIGDSGTDREVFSDVPSFGAHISQEQSDVSTEVEQSEDAIRAEIPELLTVLFVEAAENSADDKAETDIEETSAVKYEFSTEEDQEFIAQIEAYITQLEAREIVATDKQDVLASEIGAEDEDLEKPLQQSQQAFVEVLEITQRVQGLQARMETIVAMKVDSDEGFSTEEFAADIKQQQEALEAELYEACEQFLASIGVEPTEAKVQAFVERVLRINFEALEKEYQFSLEQLATMGTHEYKLNDWFQRVRRVFSIADSSLHRTIGTFATRYAAIAD